MKLISGLLGFALIGTAIAMGGNPGIFFNAPSALIVLGGTVLFTLGHHSIGDSLAAVKAALGSDSLDADATQRHASVLSTARIVAMGCGVTGFLIGLVQMLSVLDDPSTMGPSMAVALLTAFYSVILSELVFGPMINRLYSRSTGASDSSSKLAGPAKATLAVFVIGSLVTFGALVLSMT
jgi:flagellar motor component MotA